MPSRLPIPAPEPRRRDDKEHRDGRNRSLADAARCRALGRIVGRVVHDGIGRGIEHQCHATDQQSDASALRDENRRERIEDDECDEEPRDDHGYARVGIPSAVGQLNQMNHGAVGEHSSEQVRRYPNVSRG
jgi:hypothetical protein